MPASAEFMMSMDAMTQLLLKQQNHAAQQVSELVANGAAYDHRALGAAIASGLLLSDDPEKAMMTKLGYDSPRGSEAPK